ncbi:MAG: DUF255 domain-containing protein [Halanaeroarchaeum sp.]
MDDAADAMKVEWREWGDAAFAEAHDTDRPVLLSITAPWCGWCQTMDATTYADPRIGAMLNHDFVPIRVNADRRPRVRERYTVGGFPSTVAMTPEGRLIAAASYLDETQMRRVLERVTQEWDSADETGRLPPALQDGDPPVGSLTAEVERYINGQVDAQYDEANAGWGAEAKFPLPATVEFALRRQSAKATATLDAIRDTLFDEYDGGFFRYAGERDWSNPTREKLLAVNAGLLRAFANGYLTTGEERYRKTADRTVDFLTAVLWTGEGFGNSQQPGEYFDLPPEERETVEAPPIDEATYAGPNALAAEALAWYHGYTDDREAKRFAERTLSMLESEYLDDGVVDHCREGCESGLLSSQASALRAFATAAQVLDPSYAETAAVVADATIERLQTGSGAFRDGPPEGPALLDRALYPVDDNARMADALLDLHHVTGEAAYRDAALSSAEAFAGAADEMGANLAAYGTAAARLLRRPLVVGIGSEPGSDLHRAALRMADHEKVVVPDCEDVDAGRAALLTADGIEGAAEDPAALADLVAEYARVS